MALSLLTIVLQSAIKSMRGACLPILLVYPQHTAVHRLLALLVGSKACTAGAAACTAEVPVCTASNGYVSATHGDDN